MLLISALACYFIRFISLEFFAMLPNILILTIDKFQIWRLFTSFLWPGASSTAFLSVLFDFYILYTFLPDMVVMYLLSKSDCLQCIFCWRWFFRHFFVMLFWLWRGCCLLGCNWLVLWISLDVGCFRQFSCWFGLRLLKILISQQDSLFVLVYCQWNTFRYVFWFSMLRMVLRCFQW